VAPHHDGGSIGTLAGIHLAAALPNSYALQVPVLAAGRDSAMRAEIPRKSRMAAWYTPTLLPKLISRNPSLAQ
jgi:hypothetical protein